MVTEGCGPELQMQLQQQIELRIEAQAKYLQSELKKAQEALASYNCSSEYTDTQCSRNRPINRGLISLFLEFDPILPKSDEKIGWCLGGD
ncbi:unnamed protein product [Rhodiola kirilowii]